MESKLLLIAVNSLFVLVAAIAGYLLNHFLQRSAGKSQVLFETRRKIYGVLSAHMLSLITKTSVLKFHRPSYGTGAIGEWGDKFNFFSNLSTISGRGLVENMESMPHYERCKLVNNIQMAIGEALLVADVELKAKLLLLGGFFEYSGMLEVWQELTEQEIEKQESIGVPQGGISDANKAAIGMVEIKNVWDEIIPLMRAELGVEG